MAIPPFSLPPSAGTNGFPTFHVVGNELHVGQTIQATACAAPLNLNLIQRDLGRDLLNASRTAIDPMRIQGLSNDEAVFLQGQRNLPKTGSPRFDRGVDKLMDAADYIPQATEDAMTTALRWGFVSGAGVGSLTTLAGLALLLLSRGKEKPLLVESSRKLKAAIPIAYGFATGTLAALGGFCYSFIQNFRDFHRHMAKASLERSMNPKANSANRLG